MWVVGLISLKLLVLTKVIFFPPLFFSTLSGHPSSVFPNILFHLNPFYLPLFLRFIYICIYFRIFFKTQNINFFAIFLHHFQKMTIFTYQQTPIQTFLYV